MISETRGPVDTAVSVRRAGIRSSCSLTGITLLAVMALPRLHEMVPYLVYADPGKLVILLCLFCILTSKGAVRVPWRRLPQVRLYVLFVIWLFISATMGVWPSASIAGGVSFLKNMVFFLLFMKSIDSMNDLYKVVRVLLLGMLVFSTSIIARASMGRADAGGYTLDPNEGALLIAVLMPFLYYFFRGERGFFRMAFLFGMVLGAGAVLCTGSRGGVIALCVVLSYAYLVDSGMFLKKILLIAVTVSAVFLFMPDGIRERFDRLGDTEQDYNLTHKHGRMMVWERAMSLVEENPVFGVGMHNFIFVESEVNNQSRGVVTHNFILQVATELGIPGALILLSIFAVSWRQARRMRAQVRRTPNNMRAYALLSGLECAWLAFFIGGQFLSVAFSSQIIFMASCSTLVWKCHLRGDFRVPAQQRKAADA
ncbi:O-antigen ligase family protein [Desulfovibrio psychrotolerans]|uniref:O-antigen ligase-related domain-containing protein n=1 Tax=Desulfovibrio psychrotolerans TaxID=415242 RepID=A0A7J0BUF7_9BACT|nr:O-antigen ligase family protein [Desulfovibrio psychrotolerans]GFM37298.1 hypothetical protein DSM19430T_19820 [Desulfovibrio psychrotolerans]